MRALAVELGRQLARAEPQIIFRTLFRRIPTLHLATTIDRIDFKHDRLAYGCTSCPPGGDCADTEMPLGI